MISAKSDIDCYKESGASTNLWRGGWPQTRIEFGAFVDRYWDRLVNIAFHRLRNYEESEDVAQDVLVKAYTNRKKLGAVQQVQPYLYRMVVNACIERIRQRHTIIALEELGAQDLPESSSYALRQLASVEEFSVVEALLQSTAGCTSPGTQIPCAGRIDACRDCQDDRKQPLYGEITPCLRTQKASSTHREGAYHGEYYDERCG